MRHEPDASTWVAGQQPAARTRTMTRRSWSTGGLGGVCCSPKDTGGVPSVAEREDLFDWALAAGDLGTATMTAGSPSAASASRAQ